MQDVLREAQGTGECLTLKVFLQIEERALEFLVFDLRTRSEECCRENLPSAETARRHRTALDEALRRFERSVDRIPANGQPGSIRVKMAGFVDDFYMRLRILLPFIDTSAILVDVPLTRKAVWSERLKNAATEIESLAEKLDQVLLEIRDVLAKKQAIWEDISDSIGKMQRML